MRRFGNSGLVTQKSKFESSVYHLQLTFSWPEFSHMVPPNLKGDWEIEPSYISSRKRRVSDDILLSLP